MNNTHPVQIQISQIDNGYLIVSPAKISPAQQIQLQQNNQSLPTVAHFSSDYQEVCDYIRSFFPPTVVK